MRYLLSAFVLLFGSCPIAAAGLKECPVQVAGPQELDGECHCQDVKPDAFYDAKKSCLWTAPGIPSSIPVSPAVRPSGNNRAFILVEPLVYEVGSTGVKITVPAGFVTDYASIPRRLWSVYSPHGQYSRAAIVHDYLYWSQLCSRLQSDNLFMIAMKESRVDATTRETVYGIVRLAGDSSWKANAIERKANMPKFVPLGRTDFSPNETWERYRMSLVREGVRDPAFTGKEYCALGDSTEVPSRANRNKVSARLNIVERMAARPPGSL